MRTLLLCASHNDLGLIRSLKKLGCFIICTGKIPGLIGEKYVDEYIPLDYSDKQAVLQLAKEKRVDAIVQCCNDFGVYTASWIAQELGLPGYDPYEKTLILHNKDRFKKFALEHGIMTCPAASFDDEESAVEWAKSRELPLIVKPTDASAGNGIQKIERRDGIDTAVRQAFACSRDGRIVLEPYLEGEQRGFCTFLKERKVIACCSNNEYSIVNPYRVEIDTFPASDDDGIYQTLISQIEKMADLLQLKDGIFHLQYLNVNGTPYILEVMRRILGNMYSIPASLSTGFDWDYWETRCRLGLPIDNIPTGCVQEGCYAYKTILAEGNGRIQDVSIPPVYERYVLHKCMLKKRGDLIENFRSQPVGFLFLCFSNEREMLETLIEDYRNDLVKLEGE